MEKQNKVKAARRIPKISEAELVVMKVLWAQSPAPATANQVVDALAGRTDSKPKTIQTLLARLTRKKALSHRRQGREYIFTPLIAEGDYLHEAGRSFLGRLFGGELTPFLASFLEREELSPAEIKELRRLLEEKLP